MSQPIENFKTQAVDRFSQGPEKDTSIDEEVAIRALLNDLPSEISLIIEAMDPFTRRTFLEAYETQLRKALSSGKDIREDATLYADSYERYGWQYDETLFEPSPDIKTVFERRRTALLSRVAMGLRQQIELRGENDD